MLQNIIKNEKFRRFADTVFDGRIGLFLMLVYSVLVTTALGNNDYAYFLPSSLCVYAVLCFLYGAIIKKIKRPVSVVITCTVLLVTVTVVQFVRGFEINSFYVVFADLSLFAFLIFKEKQDDRKILNIYFCIITLFDTVMMFLAFKNNAGNLFDSVTEVCENITININQLGALNLCGLFLILYLIQKSILKRKKGEIIFYSSLFLIFNFTVFAIKCRTALLCELICLCLFSALVVYKKADDIKIDKHKLSLIIKTALVFVIIIGIILSCFVVKFAVFGSQSDGALSNLFSKHSDRQDDPSSIDPAIYERIFKFRHSIEFIRESPFTGVGLNNLKAKFLTVYKQSEAADRYLEYVNNGYLQVAVYDGILVFAAFLVMLVLIYIISTKVTIKAFKNRNKMYVYEIFALFSVMLTLLIYNLVEGNFITEIRPIATIFCLVSGYFLSDKGDIDEMGIH